MTMALWRQRAAQSPGPGAPAPRGAAAYPTMAAVGRVLCCGWAEPPAERATSLPAFSQSKGSFSVTIRSFMLLSNTDMSSCTQNQRRW